MEGKVGVVSDFINDVFNPLTVFRLAALIGFSVKLIIQWSVRGAAEIEQSATCSSEQSEMSQKSILYLLGPSGFSQENCFRSGCLVRHGSIRLRLLEKLIR